MTKSADKLALIKRMREFVDLQKHGINWFAQCPFCNDRARSFCVTHAVEDYRCFNCSAKGSIKEFFERFNANAHTENQLRIE